MQPFNQPDTMTTVEIQTAEVVNCTMSSSTQESTNDDHDQMNNIMKSHGTSAIFDSTNDIITEMPSLYLQYSNSNDKTNENKRTLRTVMIFVSTIGPLLLLASTAYAFTINPFDRTDFNQVSISETIDGNRTPIIACRIAFAVGGALLGILATFRQIQIGMNYKHFHTINRTTNTLQYKRWQRCNKCGMFLAIVAVFSFVTTAVVTTSMHANIHLLSALSAIFFTGLYHYVHGCLIKHERDLQEKETFVTRKLEFYLLMVMMTWCTISALYFGYLMTYELYVEEPETDKIRGFFLWQWQLLWIGNILFLFYGEIFYRDPFNDQLTVFYDEHLKDNQYIPNCCLKYCLCYCCDCWCCKKFCQCCCDDVTRITSMRNVHAHSSIELVVDG